MLDNSQLGGFVTRDHPGKGMRPTVRFLLAALLTAAWVGFAIWSSGPWRDDLDAAIGPIAAWLIPLLLAYIPGLIIGFMAATLVVSPYHEPALEPPAGPWAEGQWPPVTVLIAARNEEASIEKTLERVADSKYGGAVTVLLADNGSTDDTGEVAAAAAGRLGLRYRRVFEAEPGKFHALNSALATVETPIVVTLDADTYLHSLALSYLVAHVASRPQDQHVSACAGALIVENSDQNLFTRMQQWDYRLGINGVKRMQGAYNSALVAQGAFSAYWTDDLRARRRLAGRDRRGHRAHLDDARLAAASCSTSRSRSRRPPCLPGSAVHDASGRAGRGGCSRGSARCRRGASRGCWPRSSPASTTWCRCSTSATSSSGSPA